MGEWKKWKRNGREEEEEREEGRGSLRDDLPFLADRWRVWLAGPLIKSPSIWMTTRFYEQEEQEEGRGTEEKWEKVRPTSIIREGDKRR